MKNNNERTVVSCNEYLIKKMCVNIKLIKVNLSTTTTVINIIHHLHLFNTTNTHLVIDIGVVVT